MNIIFINLSGRKFHIHISYIEYHIKNVLFIYLFIYLFIQTYLYKIKSTQLKTEEEKNWSYLQ